MWERKWTVSIGCKGWSSATFGQTAQKIPSEILLGWPHTYSVILASEKCEVYQNKCDLLKYYMSVADNTRYALHGRNV